MKRLMSTFITCLALCGLGTLAWAQEDVQSLRDAVVKACENDLKTYCSQVTPGEKRLLACVYAHEDKLSDQCTYALYQASVVLEQLAQAVVQLFLREAIGEPVVHDPAVAAALDESGGA